MKKKIAILNIRNNELKLFLPVVRALLDSDSLEPFLIATQTMNQGNKQDQNYLPALNPFHDRMDVEYINSIGELPAAIRRRDAAVLITSGVLENALLTELRRLKVRTLYLQHSLDMVAVWPRTTPQAFYQLMDGFLCFSDYWKERMLAAIGREKVFDSRNDLAELEGRLHVVGLPELDQVKDFDKKALLAKYRLDAEGKRIVFFDPVGIVATVPNFYYKYIFSAFGPLPYRVRHLWASIHFDLFYAPRQVENLLRYCREARRHPHRLNYEKLFRGLRDSCRRQDCLLISKSRPKNNDPDFVREGCDLFTYDQGYLPFTLLELLAVSDYYVGFNSTAILEAVYCGLPALAIQAFPTQFQFSDYGGGVYQYIEECLATPGEWLNFAGAVRSCRWDEDVRPYFASIADARLDPLARGAFVQKFLGFDDGRSSERVVKVIERYL